MLQLRKNRDCSYWYLQVGKVLRQGEIKMAKASGEGQSSDHFSTCVQRKLRGLLTVQTDAAGWPSRWVHFDAFSTVGQVSRLLLPRYTDDCISQGNLTCRRWRLTDLRFLRPGKPAPTATPHAESPTEIHFTNKATQACETQGRGKVKEPQTCWRKWLSSHGMSGRGLSGLLLTSSLGPDEKESHSCKLCCQIHRLW